MSKAIKVLVAEDDQDIRELILITLKFHGFATTSVINGASAVEKAQEDDFDLIILDVRMPGMDGYEACRILRQMERTRKTPVIMLSAKGQESEIKAGFEAGANKYILKPFAPDELVQIIHEVTNSATNGRQTTS
jgi:DNA-binding response OmpR family regulator